MDVPVLRKKFTVHQYQQMAELGILTERDRAELINGEILEMSPVGRLHAACVDRLTEWLVLQLASQAIVRVQSPICLSDDSEPQPDISTLRRRDDFYAQRHPQSQDMLVLIEVADTTVEFDRTMKLPLYAREGIKEVWIVDFNGQVVEVYRDLDGSDYRVMERYERGQAIALQGLECGAQQHAESSIAVEQILG